MLKPGLNKRVWIFLPCLVLLALAGAGCGGESDDEGEPTLNHGALVKRADSICKRTGEKVSRELEEKSAELEKAGKNLTPADAEEAVTTITLPAVQTMADELAGLNASSADAQKLDAIAREFKRVADDATEDPNDVAANPYGKAAKMAEDLGSEQCGLFG